MHTDSHLIYSRIVNCVLFIVDEQKPFYHSKITQAKSVDEQKFMWCCNKAVVVRFFSNNWINIESLMTMMIRFGTNKRINDLRKMCIEQHNEKETREKSCECNCVCVCMLCVCFIDAIK